ncbi:carbon storage regulator CsrA [Cytobacillus suaedae]|nr:carbon storage regulator CsrA [Cytobacillus suaedae]
MLVLTRKIGESIQISDDIELTVLSIDGEQIKLGIKAPRNIDIHRKEVYLSIQEENSKAASGTFDLLTKLNTQLKHSN